eukprot:4585196-Amphidinium_carterae.1
MTLLLILLPIAAQWQRLQQLRADNATHVQSARLPQEPSTQRLVWRSAEPELKQNEHFKKNTAMISQTSDKNAFPRRCFADSAEGSIS